MFIFGSTTYVHIKCSVVRLNHVQIWFTYVYTYWMSWCTFKSRSFLVHSCMYILNVVLYVQITFTFGSSMYVLGVYVSCTFKLGLRLAGRNMDPICTSFVRTVPTGGCELIHMIKRETATNRLVWDILYMYIYLFFYTSMSTHVIAKYSVDSYFTVNKILLKWTPELTLLCPFLSK